MIKISERLKSLSKYIELEDKVIDVGCDHAKLDIYLVQSGLQNRIYVCDVNENALDNGKSNIEKWDLEDKVIPILGYGIEKTLGLDVDTLLISGMGSKNIIEILSSPYIDKFYKMILQSNNNHYELRKFLMDNNYKIVEEEIVEDANKTYINIVAIKDYKKTDYDINELEFGPILIKDNDNLDYFKKLLDSYENIVMSSKSDELREKIHRLETIIDNLDK